MAKSIVFSNLKPVIVKRYFWFFVFTVFLFSCNKGNEYDYPLVFTGDVVDVSDTSATFTAKISNTGVFPILESGFMWSLFKEDTIGIKVMTAGVVDGYYKLQTNLKLLPGKKYYVRAYVKTVYSTTYGKEVTFNSAEDQIEPGTWTRIFTRNFTGNLPEYLNILTSFTINNITYFTIGNGTLYGYNHIDNTYNLVLSDTILAHAQYSTAVNGLAYIFADNSLYQFDPGSFSLSALSAYSGTRRFSALGFVIDEDIYIGLGHNQDNLSLQDCWKYNIQSDSWQQVASFPEENRSGDFAFSLNGKGYVLEILSSHFRIGELWCYHPDDNQWVQKHRIYDRISIYNKAKVTALNGFGYCFENDLYEYNPSFDFWQFLDDNPFSYIRTSNIFSANNKLYFVGDTYLNGREFQIWTYEK